jgi:hypothetical protein
MKSVMFKKKGGELNQGMNPVIIELQEAHNP